MPIKLGKIGFACKYVERGPKGIVSVPELNTCTTTITWLNRQSQTVAEQKLWDLMVHNISATYNLVNKVSKLPVELRMVRISSDLLPAYTHENWRYFWQRPDVIAYCEKHFATVGELARSTGVRLSFHPGQFCVLASVNENIVARSIEEFEYHATMARYMGYGRSFQDFKINVHISGRAGPEGIRLAYQQLTPEARNCITIENEENSWGLGDCLTISDIIPIVLDVHHNWVREGKYIASNDAQVIQVIDSWRGVRPTMHYSLSREDVLVDHSTSQQPDLQALLESGHNKQKLRAHSDFYWNHSTNTWALSFAENFDIMCESKSKNLASFSLYEQALKT